MNIFQTGVTHSMIFLRITFVYQKKLNYLWIKVDTSNHHVKFEANTKSPNRMANISKHESKYTGNHGGRS